MEKPQPAQPIQSTQPTQSTQPSRPWCEDTGHRPNPKHGPSSLCALAWELGITAEDNPDEWRELKRLTKGA